jgi:alkylresorcinol/alkylpyrone synthase
MPAEPRLLSLATAVPPYRLSQREVAAKAPQIFAGLGGRLDYLLPVYDHAGIETRYSCVPLDWYMKPSGWQDRNALYLENALDLMARAAKDCLSQAGLGPEAVDTIRRDLQRLPVFGLGCAGGVLGLARAAALARAAPGSRVLLLVVELCGLTFRATDTGSSNVVATALFGDGAAAALIAAEDAAPRSALLAWGEHTWPASLDVMGWRVEDDGFGVLFSRDIPTILRKRFGDAVDTFLARQGLARSDLAGVVCHPGGAKVIDAMEEVFDLAPGAMVEARAVLRDYGNMSAATLLFVLEKVLANRARGRFLLTGLGPGFTAGFLVLEVQGP